MLLNAEAMPKPVLDDVELRPCSAEQLEKQVVWYVNELADPDSELHKDFYGPGGVQPRELQAVNRPSGGHSLLIQDETEHSLKLGDKVFNTGAFKRRGAYLAALEADRFNPDLTTFITASAGNHALGVAMAAAALGKQAHIYCRSDISPVKAAKLKALGAVLHRNDPAEDDTLEHAMKRAQEASGPDEDGKKPNYYLHPFDQVEVIAGQATVGLEMLQSLQQRAAAGEFDLKSDPVEVLVQVGGGGLLSGVAIVFKWARDKKLIGDNVRVIGVQMERCDAGIRSVERVRAGKQPTNLFGPHELNTWSDGTAVTQVGKLPLLVMQDERYVQGFQRVSELEVANAMHELTGVLSTPVEPAGALSYAAAKLRATTRRVRNGLGETVNPKTVFVSTVSGANASRETYDRSTKLRNNAYYANLALLAGRVSHNVVRSPREGSRGRCQVWAGPVTRRLALVQP